MTPEEIIRTLEKTGDVILITDTEANIRYASQSIQDLTGYEPGELIGKNPRIFRSDSTPASIYDDLWETILSHQKWSGVLENRRKDGSTYLERLTITPVQDEDGKNQWFVANKRDATMQGEKNLVSPMYADRDIPSDRKALLDFMSHMSYEFRTSLNSIVGFTQILREDLTSSLDPTQKEYFDILTHSSGRLLHTIEDVLLLIQLETGDCAIDVRDIPIAKELKTILSEIMVLTKTESIRFIKVIEDNGALVPLDRQYFEQILSHLLINAIKFTQKGTITVGLETKGGLAKISVIDTGVGISERFKPYVFLPFQQEEIGYNQEFEGAGLGLTISKKIAELMRGSLGFESRKNEGSTFTLTFPITGWSKDPVSMGEGLQTG